MISRGFVIAVVVAGVVGLVGLGFSPLQALSEKKKEQAVEMPSKGLPPTAGVSVPTSTNPLHGKVFGKWEIICEKPVDSKQEKCYASQSQVSVEKKVRIIKFSVGRIGVKDEWVAVTIVPLGIDIPAGVAFKVDEQPQESMRLQQCVPEGCVASLAIDQKILASFKSGKILHVGMIPSASSKTLDIPVELAGISTALSALSK